MFTTLRRYTRMNRGGPLKRKSRLRARPRTRPYGGSTPEHPNVGDFQRFIRERDGDVCQLCGLRCGPLGVAHLLYKVQAGGRHKVSVNFAWNACVLGSGPGSCHEAQEHSKTITAHLVCRLIARYCYVLPAEACARLERYLERAERERAEADEFPNGFDPHLSPTDGRA